MLVDEQPDPVDRVADVDVRLPLFSVSEHGERTGIFAKRFVEVVKMAVGVALSEHRDEAQDDPREAVALAVRLDQPFRRELRCAVGRGLHGKRRAFRCRKHFGLAVDRPAGREDDPRDPVLPHRLEHLERGLGVLAEVAARVLEAEADVGVRRHVEDDVAACERARQQLAVEDIALDDRGSVRPLERLDEGPLAGREVVVDDDLGAVGEKSLGQMAPDEAGTAGDERPRHSGH